MYRNVFSSTFYFLPNSTEEFPRKFVAETIYKIHVSQYILPNIPRFVYK